MQSIFLKKRNFFLKKRSLWYTIFVERGELPMEGINEIFANNLNSLMKKHGENLSELSDRIGVAYSTVSDWQHGKKMPRSGSLQKLADHYNVNISYLTSTHEDQKLNPAAAVIAAHIDDDTPESERQQIINFIENLKKARK